MPTKFSTFTVKVRGKEINVSNLVGTSVALERLDAARKTGDSDLAALIDLNNQAKGRVRCTTCRFRSLREVRL